jgi:DNA-binding CsgD family transcriptional regulator
LDLLADLLDAAARSGQSGIVLIEGQPGIGKSRLLADAVQAGLRRGFAVLRGKTDELQQILPLAPLFAALGDSPQALGGWDDWDNKADDLSERNIRLFQKIYVRYERRLTRAPTLVVLDDLQWVDHLTLLVLRALPSQFASYPVVWALARRSGDGGPGVDRLFAILEKARNCVRIQLGPLSDEAVAAFLPDLLAATPGPELIDLAHAADGNPFALIELIQGLVDEGAVRIDDGKALLATPAAAPASQSARLAYGSPHVFLPARFRALVGKWLDALSPQTRRLLQVATVLGTSFLIEDISDMMAEPPAVLLPALQEALAARVLVCGTDRLAFRHDMVWRALLEAVPIPIRAALHRQAAHMQVRRGGSLVDAAVHILHGARPGDAGVVEVLGRAAEEALATSPQTAAELAVRGLELTGAADPARLPLTTVAVEALTRAGPLSAATALAREALSQPLPAAQSGSLRLLLSTGLLLDGHTAEAVAAAEQALAEPDLPASLHDDAELNRLFGLSVLDGQAAAQRAEAMLDGAEHDNREPPAGAWAVLARARWREGRLSAALKLARLAVSCADGGSAVAWHAHPRLTLAVMLAHVREFAEAAAAVRTAREEIESTGTRVLCGVPRILQSYLDLTAGKLSTAVAEATAGVAIAEETGTAQCAPIGWGVLATAALRRGDLASATAHAERLDATFSVDGAGVWRAQRAWVAAQIADARGDPEGALQALAESYQSLSARRDLLVEEPAAAAWLVRAALSAGIREWAAAVVATAECLASDNPGIPVLLAAAAHARGIHDRDPDALKRAVAEHRDPWARAAAAEDLGTVLIDIDRDAAIRQMDQAMAAYGGAGAERDAARVRCWLRHVGVRRRHWTYADRPTSGWASLTETERAVANLVGQGLTNRQVARQMFLSPHTIGFHLRQIFRKLGIRSRVDLVRWTSSTAAAVEPPPWAVDTRPA